MERYFSYRKDKQKFIIEEVYEYPRPKIDNRKYGQYIEKLILDLLVLQQETNNIKSVNFSTCKLLETLNMINKNYTYGMDHKPQLAYFLKMDKEYVKDFYNLSYSKLVGTLESALKRLDNKMLILWKKAITIVYREENTTDKLQYDIHTIADDEDEEIIIQAEKEVAESMGYKTRRDIAIHDKWKEFNDKVLEKLKEKISCEVQYYYRSYKINFNSYVTQEQKELEMLLQQEERIITKNNLNKTLINNYKDHNEIRHEKYLHNKPAIGMPLHKHEQIKISQDYIKNNDELIDTLIDEKAKDISQKANLEYMEYKKSISEKSDKQLKELFG